MDDDSVYVVKDVLSMFGCFVSALLTLHHLL